MNNVQQLQHLRIRLAGADKQVANFLESTDLDKFPLESEQWKTYNHLCEQYSSLSKLLSLLEYKTNVRDPQ